MKPTTLSKPTLITIVFLFALLVLFVLGSIVFVAIRTVRRRRAFVRNVLTIHPGMASSASARSPSNLAPDGKVIIRPLDIAFHDLAHHICLGQAAVPTTPIAGATNVSPIKVTLAGSNSAKAGDLDAEGLAVDSESDSDSDSVSTSPTPVTALTLPSSEGINGISPKQDLALRNVGIVKKAEELKKAEVPNSPDRLDLEPIITVASFARTKRAARGGHVGLGIIIEREEEA